MSDMAKVQEAFLLFERGIMLTASLGFWKLRNGVDRVPSQEDVLRRVAGYPPSPKRESEGYVSRDLVLPSADFVSSLL